MDGALHFHTFRFQITDQPNPINSLNILSTTGASLVFLTDPREAPRLILVALILRLGDELTAGTTMDLDESE